MKYCLLFVLFIFTFSQTGAPVPPICGSNQDCNNYATANTMICNNPGNFTSAACISRTTYPASTNGSMTDPNGMCSNSFLVNTFGRFGQACRTLGTQGCQAYSPFECIGSFYNYSTNICDPYQGTNGPNFTVVQQNQRCSGNLVFPFPPIYYACDVGLTCMNYICRKYLNPGDNCFQSPIPCDPSQNLACDRDLCRTTRSAVAQDPCKSNSVCIEQECSTIGLCREKRSIPCYSNSDCPSNQPCSILNGQTSGFCARGSYLADKMFQDNPSETNAVQQVCQDQCRNRPDQRIIYDGYTYDCAALTRKIIPVGTCGIQQLIFNCQAPISNSFIHGLSFIVVVIALFFY